MSKSDTKIQKLIASITGEMDEDQKKITIAFLETISESSSSEEEEEEEEKPAKKAKGKKAKDEDEDEEEVVEEDDDEDEEEEDEKPAKKVKGKKVKDEDEDEEEDEVVEEDDDEEEEEEDEKPAKKAKEKKAKDEDEDEEEETEEDGDEDYSKMNLKKLKSLATERKMNTKILLKGSKNEEKTLIKAHTTYDESKKTFGKKTLSKLLTLAEKNNVEYDKPRGRASDDTKKLKVIEALLAAGVEA